MPEHLPNIVRLVEQHDIDLYAELTGDANPLHLDAAFAATTAMRGIVAHGTMSSNLLWQVSTEAGLCVIEMTVKFLAPVRPGDQLTAGGRRDSLGHYKLWVYNQHGIEVVGGQVIAHPG